MAEENNAGEPAQETNQVQTEEREYSAVEQRAMDMGWRPQEEFEGDPENFRSAEVFVALDPLLKRIETQSKELKNVRKAASDTAALFDKVRETEYKNALKALRQEKKEALESGDADRVISIDDQIDDLRETKPEAQAIPAEVNEPHPEFVRWVDSNSWYQTDRDMAAWADGIAPRLRQEGLSPSEVLSRLAKDVREKFPAKFRNVNRDKPNAVEGRADTRPAKSANANLKASMSSDDRRIMDNIIKQIPGMTEEKYLAQYAVVANR